MKKTTLTLSAPKRFLPDIKCNGQLLKLKRTAKNTYAATFHCDDEEKQTLHVFKHYSLSDKFWFVYGLLLYIVGFFGIFSPRWEKKCPSIDVEFTLPAWQEKIDLALSPVVIGNRALSLVGQDFAALETEQNVYTVNTVAQKRAKKVKLFSWLTFLACLICAIATTIYFI